MFSNNANFLSPPPGGVSSVEKSVSDRVKIARSLCIFFMTFVHVPPIYDIGDGAFGIAYFVFTRLLGLSSVSLLSVISGYFIVASLLKSGTFGLFSSKVKTLVVPLVAWNVLMIALLIIFVMLGGNTRALPSLDVTSIVNGLLAVTEEPVLVPLWFLRDLFVCCLFSPILYASLKRFPIAVFAVLVLFTLFGKDLHILQRPQLMLFFALGMWLRLADIREVSMDRAAGFLAAGVVVMATVFLTIRLQQIRLSEIDQTLLVTLDTLLRITMAAGFWRLTKLIQNSPAAGLFVWFEPYAFFLFCSHAVLFTFGGVILRRLLGEDGSELFPIVFFALPVLGVIAAVIGLQLINWSRVLLFLFNAGHKVPPLGLFQDARAREANPG